MGRPPVDPIDDFPETVPQALDDRVLDTWARPVDEAAAPAGEEIWRRDGVPEVVAPVAPSAAAVEQPELRSVSEAVERKPALLRWFDDVMSSAAWRRGASEPPSAPAPFVPDAEAVSTGGGTAPKTLEERDEVVVKSVSSGHESLAGREARPPEDVPVLSKRVVSSPRAYRVSQFDPVDGRDSVPGEALPDRQA